MSTIEPVTVTHEGATLTFTRRADSVRIDFVIPVPEAGADFQFFTVDVPSDAYLPINSEAYSIVSEGTASIRVIDAVVTYANIGTAPYEGALVYPAAPLDIDEPPAGTTPTANVGAAPYDPDSDVGFVRVLIGDTDPTNVVAGQGEYVFFGDAEIQSLLDRLGGRPHRVAANFIRQIALNQVLLLKKFSSADLSVDGGSIARDLLRLADAIKKEGDELEEELSVDASFSLVPVGGISTAALYLSLPPALAPEMAQRWRMPWTA